jgi:hypothetical protein
MCDMTNLGMWALDCRNCAQLGTMWAQDGMWAVLLPVAWSWTAAALTYGFFALRLGVYAVLVSVAWVRIIENAPPEPPHHHKQQSSHTGLNSEALWAHNASAGAGGGGGGESSSASESIEDWWAWLPTMQPHPCVLARPLGAARTRSHSMMTPPTACLLASCRSIWEGESDVGDEAPAQTLQAPTVNKPAPVAAVAPGLHPPVTVAPMPTPREQQTSVADAVLPTEVAAMAEDEDEKQVCLLHTVLHSACLPAAWLVMAAVAGSRGAPATNIPPRRCWPAQRWPLALAWQRPAVRLPPLSPSGSARAGGRRSTSASPG